MAKSRTPRTVKLLGFDLPDLRVRVKAELLTSGVLIRLVAPYGNWVLTAERFNYDKSIMEIRYIGPESGYFIALQACERIKPLLDRGDDFDEGVRSVIKQWHGKRHKDIDASTTEEYEAKESGESE